MIENCIVVEFYFLTLKNHELNQSEPKPKFHLGKISYVVIYQNVKTLQFS